MNRCPLCGGETNSTFTVGWEGRRAYIGKTYIGTVLHRSEFEYHCIDSSRTYIGTKDNLEEARTKVEEAWREAYLEMHR